MRRLIRWLARAGIALLVLVVLLFTPIAYVEIACQGESVSDGYRPIITDPAWQRAESRTLMTYPEWHIVHAYDDYAEVIRKGDPHEFGYLRAISGFWSALCPLSQKSATMGGVTGETKLTIYTIGVSFSAEMAMKALYEETLGRMATWLRRDRTHLDDLSARQAADYAKFLQQVPWYRWDFASDAEALRAGATTAFRDKERAFALGLEYRAKGAYARLIAYAAEGIGADELRLRLVVRGLSPAELAALEGVSIIDLKDSDVLIETDRYRSFTRLLEHLAATGADLVEIAGNNDILFTALSDSPDAAGALYSFQRQGYGDWRHLVVVPVSDLLNRLRELDGLRLEHVHDY